MVKTTSQANFVDDRKAIDLHVDLHVDPTFTCSNPYRSIDEINLYNYYRKVHSDVLHTMCNLYSDHMPRKPSPF